MAQAKKILCPMMGGECVEDGAIRDGELVACRFWVTVQGLHPQTGETINSGDCSIAWMPVLLIENSKVNRETGAAVESFRNETVTRADTTNVLMSGLLQATGMIPGVSVSQAALINAATSTIPQLEDNQS